MLANNAGERCARRFEELRREYPGQQDFFDANREALISSLEDVRSEKELTKIRKHIELSRVEANLSYEYPSSSIYAVEDLLIDLLDFKRELFRKVEEMDKIVISG